MEIEGSSGPSPKKMSLGKLHSDNTNKATDQAKLIADRYNQVNARSPFFLIQRDMELTE